MKCGNIVGMSISITSVISWQITEGFQVVLLGKEDKNLKIVCISDTSIVANIERIACSERSMDIEIVVFQDNNVDSLIILIRSLVTANIFAVPCKSIFEDQVNPCYGRFGSQTW